MTLTEPHETLLAAACTNVINAGIAHRDLRHLLSPSERAKADDHYAASVDYLGKLLRKLEASYAKS